MIVILLRIYSGFGLNWWCLKIVCERELAVLLTVYM